MLLELQAQFHRYAVAGDPAALFHGDFYAGKGFALYTLQTPAGLINVVNTHICANYAHTYEGLASVFKLYVHAQYKTETYCSETATRINCMLLSDTISS